MSERKMNKFFNSFRYAMKGLVSVWKSELNFKIHIVFALLVLMAGIVFQISPAEWIIICICIGMVLSAEAFNTVIEKMASKMPDEFDALRGEIKDISAGAVFVLALISAIVGLIIFLPKITIWF